MQIAAAQPQTPCLPRRECLREVCESSPHFDQHLRRENIRQTGTDGPTAAAPVPFDIRLARLNAQLRESNRTIDALRAVDVYA